jgi:hypothetical protein
LGWLFASALLATPPNFTTPYFLPPTSLITTPHQ